MARKGALAIAALLVIAGCETMGVGTGSSKPGGVTATFAWKSESGTNGAMTANLSTGDTYQGPYFEVTHETNTDTLGPLWVGWEGRGRWGGWDGGWGPGEGFSTTYTGKVLANLAGPGGNHMRCRFTLVQPSSGLSGGGTGRCQLPDGTIIHADFPSS